MSAGPPLFRVKPAGEAALLIELGDAIAPETTDRVLRLTAALEAAALPGVTDLAPGYVSLLVVFDPAVVEAEALADDLRRLAATADDAPLPAGKLVTIPVAYGGELGPDIGDVAAHAGLSETEVAARHAGAEYRVACPGFVPGWAYLGGLPPELATPRRGSPRPRVPVGSVAIGGAQTGVYPFETPGGWNLIGRTPLRLFDPASDEPALLLPGDRVRFQPISPGEYDEIKGRLDGDRAHSRAPLQTQPRRPDRVLATQDAEPGGTGGSRGMGDSRTAPTGPSALGPRPSIHVLTPGLLTTVQDLGRPGRMRHGIGREGAVDHAALILGNRLVGNDPDAAGLEITLVGPRLRFETATIVALTGADLGATLDGQAVPGWQPVLLPTGGELVFRPDRAAGAGARAYLCVAGGIDVPPVLGSRSTYLAIGLGGHEGRALRPGDILPVGPARLPAEALLHRRLTAPPPDYAHEPVGRVVLGPQDDRFTDEGVENLLTGAYRASSRSDRMGLRLEAGPPVYHARGADLISEGIVPGSIQVPGDAQPIVLLHAAATAGGYPKVATVIGADLDRMGQVRPGDSVRFTAVSPADGRALTLAYRAALGEGAVVEAPRPAPGWSRGLAAGPPPVSAAGLPGWDSSTVARLVEALSGATAESVRIEVTAGERRLGVAVRRASG